MKMPITSPTTIPIEISRFLLGLMGVAGAMLGWLIVMTLIINEEGSML